MARCRYVRVEGERVYIPECWGGLYDKAGCYCPKPETIRSRIRELENELKDLRAQLPTRAPLRET